MPLLPEWMLLREAWIAVGLVLCVGLIALILIQRRNTRKALRKIAQDRLGPRPSTMFQLEPRKGTPPELPDNDVLYSTIPRHIPGQPSRSPVAPSPSADMRVEAPKKGDMHLFALRDKRERDVVVDDVLASPAFAREIADERVLHALGEWKGRLVHKIPNRMVQGFAEAVEVRIGSDGMPMLAVGLVGSGSLKSATLPIVSAMRVDLLADPACFKIVPKSEPMQFVQPMQAASIFVAASEPFGRWLWDVTGKKAGKHKLIVRVSGQATNASGGVSTAALPPREFPVTVRVGYGAMIFSWLKKLIGGLVIAAIGGLAAGFTREFWWPRLSAFLQALGWL